MFILLHENEIEPIHLCFYPIWRIRNHRYNEEIVEENHAMATEAKVISYFSSFDNFVGIDDKSHETICDGDENDGAEALINLPDCLRNEGMFLLPTI